MDLSGAAAFNMVLDRLDRAERDRRAAEKLVEDVRDAEARKLDDQRKRTDDLKQKGEKLMTAACDLLRVIDELDLSEMSPLHQGGSASKLRAAINACGTDFDEIPF